MNADGEPALIKLKSFREHNTWSTNSKYTHKKTFRKMKSPNYTGISLF